MCMCVKKQLVGLMENKMIFDYDLKIGLTVKLYLIKNNKTI